MLLLLADSSLVIFITLTLGVFAREGLSRLFRSPVNADLLELFFLGLMTSSLYFDLVSFWLPVDYRTLLPLAILAVAGNFLYKEKFAGIWRAIKNNLAHFFSPASLPLTIPIAILLLIYWILPCGTPDSALYHFQSILWYEKYKVVPGLVNLNARLAFNPASFLIESAYAFTRPVGQSLYPLNGVVCLFFFAWLHLRMLRTRTSGMGLVYGVLIVLLWRTLLVDLSSPSSDGLSTVCIAYVLVVVMERCLSNDRNLASSLVPVLVVLYGITAKTASFALLPLLPFLFYRLPRQQRKPNLVSKTLLIGLLIYLPWISRNYILSGYLVFPFPAAKLLNPDWAAPAGLTKLEYNLFHRVPKVEGLPVDPYLDPDVPGATMFGWIFAAWKKRVMDILFLLLACLSPLYWLIRRRWDKSASPLFTLWAVVYVATWLWFTAAPVFRFGRPYIAMCFLLPLVDGVQAQPRRIPATLVVITIILSTLFYSIKGFSHSTTYPFTLADCWRVPLKSIWHNEKEKQDFPYKTLNNGVRLYMGDERHKCINACLPCTDWDYGEIEMRGSRLDQGFRSVHYQLKAVPALEKPRN